MVVRKEEGRVLKQLDHDDDTILPSLFDDPNHATGVVDEKVAAA